MERTVDQKRCIEMSKITKKNWANEWRNMLNIIESYGCYDKAEIGTVLMFRDEYMDKIKRRNY